MDRIIFFYWQKNLEKPKITIIRRETYYLFKVGMNVEEDHWFGKKLPEEVVEPGWEPLKGSPLKRHRMKKEQERAYVRYLEYLEILQEIAMSMDDLVQEIIGWKGNESAENIPTGSVRRSKRVYCEYEKRLRDILIADDKRRRSILIAEDKRREGKSRICNTEIGKEEINRCGKSMNEISGYGMGKRQAGDSGPGNSGHGDSGYGNGGHGNGGNRDGGHGDSGQGNGGHGDSGQDNRMSALWRSCLKIPEFTGYMKYPWVKILLKNAIHPHFIVLGNANCIQQVLKDCAAGMKSVVWIGEGLFAEENEDFLEDFYQEYGLAITVRKADQVKGYRGLFLKSELPVNVLDFTSEGRIFGGELSAKSVWLDFSSSEEKRDRMRRLSPQIRYYSLRKEWDEAQKQPNVPDPNIPRR